MQSKFTYFPFKLFESQIISTFKRHYLKGSSFLKSSSFEFVLYLPYELMKYLQFSWYSLHLYKCAELWWKPLPNFSLNRKRCPCLVGFSFSHPRRKMGSIQEGTWRRWAEMEGPWPRLAPGERKGSPNQGPLNDCSFPLLKQRPFFLLEERVSCFPSSIVFYWRQQALELAHQQTGTCRKRKFLQGEEAETCRQKGTEQQTSWQSPCQGRTNQTLCLLGWAPWNWATSGKTKTTNTLGHLCYWRKLCGQLMSPCPSECVKSSVLWFFFFLIQTLRLLQSKWKLGPLASPFPGLGFANAKAGKWKLKATLNLISVFFFFKQFISTLLLINRFKENKKGNIYLTNKGKK